MEKDIPWQRIKNNPLTESLIAESISSSSLPCLKILIIDDISLNLDMVE